jgi:hypothetical protein
VGHDAVTARHVAEVDQVAEAGHDRVEQEADCQQAEELVSPLLKVLLLGHIEDLLIYMPF